MRFVFFFSSIILLIGSAQPGHAQVSASALEQLRSGNPRAAEAAFAALQKAFEAGQVTEYTLLDSYKAFYGKDAQIAAGLDRWVATFPKSSSALLARGVYYRKLGEFRRGQNYVSRTPAADLAFMANMFAKAKADLDASLELNHKSYLSALHLLNIAQFEGDDRAASRALNLATAINPTNFLARARYLVHLTPRWGGSYERVDAFIEQCRSQGMPQERVALLQAMKLDDQGHTAEERGQTQEAIAFFKRALPLSKAGGPRFRKDYISNSLRFCSHYKFGGEFCS